MPSYTSQNGEDLKTKQMTANIGVDVGNIEHLFTEGGNADWWNLYWS